MFHMKQSDASLPDSSEGVTPASRSDMKRGYSDVSRAPAYPHEDEDNELLEMLDMTPGGFVGRPKGWER